MKRLLACLLCTLFLLSCRLGVAADYYDGSTLTVPMVTVGGNTYTNAKVTISKIDSVGAAGTPPQGSFDTYSNGSLFIPTAYYNGHQYNNVTVTVGSVVQPCCTRGVSAAYLLVVNPNDRTINAYPYMNANGVPEVVTDPALAQASSSNPPTLYLDKTNNLMFDVVQQTSGAHVVTPFSFNATTGALATAGPASTYANANHVTVNTLQHLILVVTNGGQTVTYYPYNTQSGAIGSVQLGSTTNVLVTSIFQVDFSNDLVFGITGTSLMSFPIGANGIVFNPVGTIASNLLTLSGSAQNVDARPDDVNHVLLTDASLGTGLQVQAIPYSSTSLGPAGTAITQNNGGYGCAVDPPHRLFFVAGNNSSLINAYPYTLTGALSSPTSTDLSQNNLGGAFYPSGGCYDVDPDNQILFQSANNPLGVDMFLYDSQGNVNPVPAQHINMATSGSQQLYIISSRSYKRD